MSRQGLVLSSMCHMKLRVIPKSWGESSCLTVSNGDLSSKVEESLSGGVFPIEKISRLPGVMLKVFVL